MGIGSPSYDLSILGAFADEPHCGAIAMLILAH